MLVAALGHGRARELVLTARLVDAEEARTIGLIDRVHPAPELESRARELAASLAALAPLTIAATKEATRRVLAALAPRDLEERAHSFVEVPTQIAGEDEIVEKRKPDWQGR